MAPEYRVWFEESAASSEDEAPLSRVAVPAPLFLITAQRRRNDHKPIDHTHPDPYGGTGRTGFALVSAAAFYLWTVPKTHLSSRKRAKRIQAKSLGDCLPGERVAVTVLGG